MIEQNVLFVLCFLCVALAMRLALPFRLPPRINPLKLVLWTLAPALLFIAALNYMTFFILIAVFVFLFVVRFSNRNLNASTGFLWGILTTVLIPMVGLGIAMHSGDISLTDGIERMTIFAPVLCAVLVVEALAIYRTKFVD